MRYLLFVLFVGTLSTVCTAQYDEAIKRDISIYNDAYLTRDYDKYISYSIQSVVQIGGGAELMKNVATEQASLFAQNKMSIKSLSPSWIGEIYQSEGAIHVVIGQDQIMSISGSDFHKTAYFLGESVDEGASWTFIDLEPYDMGSLQVFIPGISNEINVPAKDAALKLED